jgi:hypothetical protein
LHDKLKNISKFRVLNLNEFIPFRKEDDREREREIGTEGRDREEGNVRIVYRANTLVWYSATECYIYFIFIH